MQKNALKSLKSKKVYRNRPSERASVWHSQYRIYNSLLRMRAIHELKIRTFKTVVTENGCQKQMWRENGLQW